MLSSIISDVPGDDPALIASGPTVGDTTRAADARRLVDRWRIPTTPSIDAVQSGPRVTARPVAPNLSRIDTRIIAAPAQSLEAAGAQASEAGWTVHVLGDVRALAVQTRLRPDDPAAVLISGGQCTVTSRGAGTGGPDAEYCLALDLALDGAAGIAALACDTDGVDGAAEVAGAIIDETTLSRAAEIGADPVAALAVNDSHSFFGRLGDQVLTGPTMTNVNDFRAVAIRPPALLSR